MAVNAFVDADTEEANSMGWCKRLNHPGYLPSLCARAGVAGFSRLSGSCGPSRLFGWTNRAG